MKSWIIYNRIISTIDRVTVGPILLILEFLSKITKRNSGPFQCWVMRNFSLPGWYPENEILSFEELKQIIGKETSNK